MRDCTICSLINLITYSTDSNQPDDGNVSLAHRTHVVLIFNNNNISRIVLIASTAFFLKIKTIKVNEPTSGLACAARSACIYSFEFIERRE